MGSPGLRVLVTGGAGYIGSTLIRSLLEDSRIEHVVSLDTRGTGTVTPSAKLEVVVDDVRNDQSELIESHQINVVVHLAFLLRPERNTTLAESVNIDATRRLANACAGKVKKFVYLSSTSVYGARSAGPVEHSEDDMPDPVKGFQYSEHKVAAESVIQEALGDNDQTEFAIVRACPVVSREADNFITENLQMKFLPTPWRHDPEMQFIHADDLVEFLLMSITSSKVSGVFNVAGSETIRWKAMLNERGSMPIPIPSRLLAFLIRITWNLRLQSRSNQAGIEMIRYPWLASIKKAASELGWRPKYSSREAIKSWVDR